MTYCPIICVFIARVDDLSVPGNSFANPDGLISCYPKHAGMVPGQRSRAVREGRSLVHGRPARWPCPHAQTAGFARTIVAQCPAHSPLLQIIGRHDAIEQTTLLSLESATKAQLGR